ncbi:MAG: methyltransferase [Steroidobacteraceae bacterium]
MTDLPRNQRMQRGVLTVLMLAAASMSAATTWSQSLDAATAAAIDTALAGPHRSDRNKARDQYRHPKQTLEFFGLRRDMTVVEIWPAAGWYTEVLAPVLKGTGKLYAAQYSPAAFEYQRQQDAALLDKTKTYPDVFGAAQFTALWSPGDLVIAPRGTVDLVVTFRNVHNWVNPEFKQDPAKLFGAFFIALKPGGILGVVDHRWPDAKTEDPTAISGYVSEDRVIALAKGAGFEFVGRSDINRNPKDNHQHPNGVWSLPPDLSVKEGEDLQTYLDIGESDRMTLKFRKPAAR